MMVHVHVHASFFTSIGLVFVMWFNYMFVMQMVQGHVPHCAMHPGSWSCSYCFFGLFLSFLYTFHVGKCSWWFLRVVHVHVQKVDVFHVHGGFSCL